MFEKPLPKQTVYMQKVQETIQPATSQFPSSVVSGCQGPSNMPRLVREGEQRTRTDTRSSMQCK
jgi:hypothetical protein